jgi:hypothetical protein
MERNLLYFSKKKKTSFVKYAAALTKAEDGED